MAACLMSVDGLDSDLATTLGLDGPWSDDLGLWRSTNVQPLNVEFWYAPSIAPVRTHESLSHHPTQFLLPFGVCSDSASRPRACGIETALAIIRTWLGLRQDKLASPSRSLLLSIWFPCFRTFSFYLWLPVRSFVDNYKVNPEVNFETRKIW